VTDGAIACLIRAGWFAGREVQIARDRVRYAAEGYELGPDAEAFLREYSRLTVDGGERHAIVLNGARATEGIYRELVEEYESVALTALIPVGEYHLMTIFIGDDGTFYGGNGPAFGAIGGSVPGLVDWLLNDAEAVLPQRLPNL